MVGSMLSASRYSVLIRLQASELRAYRLSALAEEYTCSSALIFTWILT